MELKKFILFSIAIFTTKPAFSLKNFGHKSQPLVKHLFEMPNCNSRSAENLFASGEFNYENFTSEEDNFVDLWCLDSSVILHSPDTQIMASWNEKLLR